MPASQKRVANACTDRVVGDILRSWRYDISGVSPELRGDLEGHLAECAHCRRWQRLHRTIDVVLIFVSTGSILSLLVALAVLHRIEPLRQLAVLHLHIYDHDVALSIRTGALIGLAASLVVWLLVALMTPVPQTLGGYARTLGERLPDNVRARFPKIPAA